MSHYAGNMDSKVAKVPTEEQEILKKSPWIHAWSDPVAGVCTYPGCTKVADLDDDGEHKLIVADANSRKLKVYKGVDLHYEAQLPDVPSSLEFFYSAPKKPSIPYIAIGCGSAVYIYHKYKPYYKFNLPEVSMNEQEKQIWLKMHNEELSLADGCKALQVLRNDRNELTGLSQTLLAAGPEGQKKLVEATKGTELHHANYVNCMSRINKNIDEEKSTSQLILGTENKLLLLLDPSGTRIVKEFKLQSQPLQILAEGLYDTDYKLTILCRDGKVYEIINGFYQGLSIDLPSKALGIVKLDKTLAVACMDNSIHGFYSRGKKAFSLYMPTSIISVELLQLKYTQQLRALLVGLSNGDIRLYNDKHLIFTLKSDEPINGMCFGPYGREEGALIANYRSGGLSIKVLQRQAKLSVPSVKFGPPAEQDMPLNIPKKTKLFIELAQRERDQYVAMHKHFHMDLAKLKLRCAQNYVKIVSEGNAPISYASGANIKLTANVTGLGPTFHVDVCVTNQSKAPVYGLQLVLNYNDKLYVLRKFNNKLPVLIPSVEYVAGLDVESIDPTGAADALKVFVMAKETCVPLVSAFINMPVFEPTLANY